MWTRRAFLEMVGKAGGAAAVYETMTAMGLLAVPGAFTGRPNLPPGSGTGQRVLILGAGIAGLTAAYELNLAGYDVTILEPQRRAGGRSFTVRRGDVIEEIDREPQLCKFDEGLYLNAGPGRLPYHHKAVLEYCRILNVPLEVYVMMSRANLYQNSDSPTTKLSTQRQIANDTRGWIADLLAKAINKGSLDQELTGIDRQALLSLLENFGDLKKGTYVYDGSSRSGYVREPEIVGCPEHLGPLPLANLLDSAFWKHKFYQSEDYEWQPTLFEPIGGMDMIVKGFLGHVGDRIRYGREVRGIRNVGDKVEVEHFPAGTNDGCGGALDTADWCISTMPLPILAAMKDKTNFSKEYKDAISAVKFASTCKVGWQANRRFWEVDNQIYGGISYINHNITQMWYPSTGYFTQKGTLTGAYNYDGNADYMASLDYGKRLELAAEGARRLHPEFNAFVPRDLGLSIAWKHVPHQRGGWADDWSCPSSAYNRLLRPEGRVWVSGDQVSHISGWQEGAIRSAHHVIDRINRPSLLEIDERAFSLPQVAPRRPAPSTQRRTRGLP